MKKYNNFSIKIPFVSIDGKVAKSGSRIVFTFREKVYEGEIMEISYKNHKSKIHDVFHLSPIWKVRTNKGIKHICFDFVGVNHPYNVISLFIIDGFPYAVEIYKNGNDYYNGKSCVLDIDFRTVVFSVPLFGLECLEYPSCGLQFLFGKGYSFEDGKVKGQRVYLHDFNVYWLPNLGTWYASNMRFIEFVPDKEIIVNKCNLFATQEDCTALLRMTKKIEKLDDDETVSKTKQITITISETDDIKSVSEKILQEFSKSN